MEYIVFQEDANIKNQCGNSYYKLWSIQFVHFNEYDISNIILKN